MANEVATLQFKANVADLKTSNAELDKLAVTAVKAEKAVDGLNDGLSGVGKAGATAGAGIDKFNQANGDVAGSSRKGNEELVRQRAEMSKLMDKIDPTRNALRSLGETQKTLYAGWRNGSIDTKQFVEFNRILAAQEKAIKSKAVSLRGLSDLYINGSISAGQMAAGWTNATQQFIDLGVQLQGGANPITALVQQGPQLAFAFGSVGNTIEAFKQQFAQVAQNFGIGAKTIDESAGDISDSVGGIAESMNDTVEASKTLATGFARFINPVTVGLVAITAGVAYLGYNIYQSYKQTETLNQAMAKTGGQARATANQLKDMASSLSEVTGTSAENAFKAVAAAASLSNTTSELEHYARVAIEVSEDTGDSVEDLVKRFKTLSGDPIKALQELGTQFGFLSPKLYEQVKAMEDAGDSAGAYSMVLASLQGAVENFKDGQKGGISEVKGWWQELIDKTKEYLLTAQDIPKIPTPADLNGGNMPTGNVWLDHTIAEMAKQQEKAADKTKANLDALAEYTKGTSDFVSDTAKRTAAAATSAMEIDKTAEQYKLRSQKIGEDIEKTERNIANIRAGGAKAGNAQLERALTLLASQKKAQEDALKSEAKRDAPKKAAAVQVDAGDRITDQYRAQNLALDAQILLLKKRSIGEANASKERKDYMLLQARYEVLEDKARTTSLSKSEKQELAAKDQALAQAKITAEKGDELAHLQRQAQLNDEITKKQNVATAAQKEQLSVAGQSTRIMQRKIRDEETRAKLAAQNASIEQQNAAVEADRIKDRTEDLGRSDWVSASKTAMADWADSATNYAKIAADAITQGMDLAASAVSNFVLTGKMDFAGFTRDVLKMITDIITRMLVMKALMAAGSAMGFDMSFMTPNAKGGVYQEPSLHAYANQVYSSPQTFQFNGRSKFAKGGVFAEAGPEAIMPLTRDANGKLGVKAEGVGGSTGDVNVVTNVNIDSNGNATATTQGAGAQVGQQISAAVQNEVRRMLKPGGLLFNRS